MSLINDALRRARQAQHQATPPASGEPRFRPIEPEPVETHPTGLLAPMTFAVVAVIALLLVWQSYRRGHGGTRTDGPETMVAARTTPSPAPTPEPETISAASVATGPAAGEQAVTVPPNERPTEIPSPALATNAAPSPPPPPPRLQAVVYNPKRPSAIIDGRTFFLGDRFGELHVSAITKDSVTLSNGKETKLLRLP